MGKKVKEESRKIMRGEGSLLETMREEQAHLEQALLYQEEIIKQTEDIMRLRRAAYSWSDEEYQRAFQNEKRKEEKSKGELLIALETVGRKIAEEKKKEEEREATKVVANSPMIKGPCLSGP